MSEVNSDLYLGIIPPEEKSEFMSLPAAVRKQAELVVEVLRDFPHLPAIKQAAMLKGL